MNREQELNNLYKNMRKKKDSELEAWEKFLENERNKRRKKEKRKRLAGFVEIPFGDKLDLL